MIEDFRAAMSASGIPYSGPIEADGKLHRFQVDGDRGGVRNGFYVLHTDEHPAGIFGCNKRYGNEHKFTWSAKGSKPLTAEERRRMAEKQKQRKALSEAAQAEREAHAQARAIAMWDAAQPSDAHPYLQKKGILGNGARVGTFRRELLPGPNGEEREQLVHNALLIQVRDEFKQTWSLQAIFAEPIRMGEDLRGKEFIYGGRKKGLWFAIGSPVEVDGVATIAVCEGFATGASIHQATGLGVIVAFDAGNLMAVATKIRRLRKSVRLVIAADNDQWTERPVPNPGLTKARAAAAAVGGEAVAPWFADFEGRPTDFNDLHLRAGLDEVKRQIFAVISPRRRVAQPSAIEPDPQWKSKLIFSNSDQPKACLANALEAARKAPGLAGRLRFNELTFASEVSAALPWDDRSSEWSPRYWTDNDDREFAVWLQRKFIGVKDLEAGKAAETAALGIRFHPVRHYLAGLKWDGVHRVTRWLSTYAGADDTSYTRAVGQRWLISAIARVHEPGCKADCMLILEGRQGAGKSSALGILGGDWFADRLSDLRHKDSAIELEGLWIVEIAELDSMNRAEVATIKAFLSRTEDRYRSPYAKRAASHPRQCVFAGTVNPEGGYLKDATGARRFWPVLTRVINVDQLRADRDQIWAEALVLYQAHYPWWLDNPDLVELAKDQQADRHQDDPWADVIRDYLCGHGAASYETRRSSSAGDCEMLKRVTITEVLKSAVNLQPDRWGQSEQIRVARILISLGYQRVRATDGALRPWVYRLQA